MIKNRILDKILNHILIYQITDSGFLLTERTCAIVQEKTRISNFYGNRGLVWEG